jgi:hypothetical protein
MQSLNHHYYIGLLQEQRMKQLIFNHQIQLELSGISESEMVKDSRQQDLKLLAYRILQINNLMEPWLNTFKLDIDRLIT